MKINMREWRKNVIASKDVIAVPVMTHPGIDATGHSVREAITTGIVHAKAIRYLANHYPTGACCTAMDLTVEADSFGAPILFPENEIATVSGRLLKDADDIHRLKIPTLESGRIKEYLKANVIAAREVIDRPVFAGCIGPFSLAGRLYDMSEIMILAYSEPELTHELLEKCTDFILHYCIALKAAGSNGVVMAEPAAGLLSNDGCLEFSSKYVKKIVDAVQDDYFMVILHNCGNTGHCTQAMVATGADAYHFGNKCDMAEVLKEVPQDKLAMGNLDPVSIFKQGTADEMRQAATELLERCSSYPNFVLSSGCDTPPDTPLANIDAFFEALHTFNDRKNSHLY
jgi:uroporphyrinogen decarboxylase